MVKYDKKTDRVTKPEGKAAVIGADEMDRLFSIDDGFQSIRDRALFGICRYTACRINEACQLLSDDVFTKAGKVRKEITFRASTTKGGYGQKTVKVSDALRELLEQYGDSGKSYLFPGRHGLGHLNPVSASNIFKAVCDRLELEHVSTHSFRRTSLNRLKDAGYRLEEIQAISGHKNLNSLAEYLEVSETAKKAMVSVL